MQIEKFESEQEKYALMLAKAWVGSALYRDNPEGFLTYRDSIMKTVDLTNDDFNAFVEKHKAEPEVLGPFTEKVKIYTDSLIKLEDSLRVVRDSVAADTLNQDTL